MAQDREGSRSPAAPQYVVSRKNPNPTCLTAQRLDPRLRRGVMLGRTPRQYTGSQDSDDFASLEPDQAAALMAAYNLLGEAFADSDDEAVFGRGWLLDVPLELVRALAQRRAIAEMELLAAIRLARLQGGADADLAKNMHIRLPEFQAKYGHRQGAGGWPNPCKETAFASP